MLRIEYISFQIYKVQKTKQNKFIDTNPDAKKYFRLLNPKINNNTRLEGRKWKTEGEKIYNQVNIQIKIKENTQRQDRQCTYNVELRRVRATIVAVEKQ